MNEKIFVNLHAHSVYSIGDSIAPPDEMAKKAKELGMSALALTDHGTLAGWLQFKNACKKYGIKPIFGIEAYFTDDVSTIYKVNENIDILKETIKPLVKAKFKKDKKELEKYQIKLSELQEERTKLRKYNHLILLAKNEQGRDNLIKIHNDAVLDGVYYKPRIDFSVLEKHKGGIIATSACLGSRVSKLLANNDFDGAKEIALRYQNIFGESNFYLELQLHDIKLQTDVNIEMIKLSKATNIPLSISCDSHYLDEDGADTRALIRNLDKEPDSLDNDSTLRDLYIKNEDMLLESWRKYMPGYSADILANAIVNTRKIADMIEEFEFDTSIKFPHFETPDNLSQEAFLKKKAIEGLINRGLENNQIYIDRLKKEIDTVSILGFASYFNIVADVINYSKKSQPIGPSRGSVGGSLLAYLLGITEVDPIKFELYFERFLDLEKSIISPSFGLELKSLELDLNTIVEHDGNCACHKH